MEDLNSKKEIFKVADPLKSIKLSLTINQCVNFFVLKENLLYINKYLFTPKIFCLN